MTFRPNPKPAPRPKKSKKPINKFSKKIEVTRQQEKEYYAKAIEANRAKNKGKLVCDNCDETFTDTKFCCCHCLGKGAEPRAYLFEWNHFILCPICREIEGSGDVKSLRIYPEWEAKKLRARQELIPPHRR